MFVCVRERESQRERECVCVCVFMFETVYALAYRTIYFDQIKDLEGFFFEGEYGKLFGQASLTGNPWSRLNYRHL